MAEGKRLRKWDASGDVTPRSTSGAIWGCSKPTLYTGHISNTDWPYICCAWLSCQWCEHVSNTPSVPTVGVAVLVGFLFPLPVPIKGVEVRKHERPNAGGYKETTIPENSSMGWQHGQDRVDQGTNPWEATSECVFQTPVIEASCRNPKWTNSNRNVYKEHLIRSDGNIRWHIGWCGV